jgi:hypothetical protein
MLDELRNLSFQARTNLSVLLDVSGCLRDAMDTMFNNGTHTKSNTNGHTVMTQEDNDIIVDVVNDDDDDSGTSSNGASPSTMTKRKLPAPSLNKPGDDLAKRLCTPAGQH